MSELHEETISQTKQNKKQKQKVTDPIILKNTNPATGAQGWGGQDKVPGADGVTGYTSVPVLGKRICELGFHRAIPQSSVLRAVHLY